MTETGKRKDAADIFLRAVNDMLPDSAVKKALSTGLPGSDMILIGIGKASWTMAKAAAEELGARIRGGAIITKYGHSRGPIPGIEIYEAGHPLPDIETLRATERILEITGNLEAGQTVLFLVSGGGSSLFEKPLPGLSLQSLTDITSALLLGGASIDELNTVRKHLSSVKGGRFALHCAPAKIYQITLSDVLGDRLDMIAAGPASSDPSTSEDALYVLEKYGMKVHEEILSAPGSETPKSLDNVTFRMAGNIAGLCRTAKRHAESRGYLTDIVTDRLEGEAAQAGRDIAKYALGEFSSYGPGLKRCLIWGGETTVRVTGGGKGGRSQELALAAAEQISGKKGIVILSAGSDGTDGPTDAAGGIVDGSTWEKIRAAGCDPMKMLKDNDSYTALEAAGALFKPGPTGTNVNDLVIALA